jgi:hypothetical protein
MIAATALRIVGLKGDTVIALMRLKRTPGLPEHNPNEGYITVQPTTLDQVAEEAAHRVDACRFEVPVADQESMADSNANHHDPCRAKRFPAAVASKSGTRYGMKPR